MFVSSAHTERKRERAGERERISAEEPLLLKLMSTIQHTKPSRKDRVVTDRVLSAVRHVKRINCGIQRMGITDKGIKLGSEGGETEEQEETCELKRF
jgi:hypothetical protein